MLYEFLQKEEWVQLFQSRTNAESYRDVQSLTEELLVDKNDFFESIQRVMDEVVGVFLGNYLKSWGFLWYADGRSWRKCKNKNTLNYWSEEFLPCILWMNYRYHSIVVIQRILMKSPDLLKFSMQSFFVCWCFIVRILEVTRWTRSHLNLLQNRFTSINYYKHRNFVCPTKFGHTLVLCSKSSCINTAAPREVLTAPLKTGPPVLKR